MSADLGVRMSVQVNEARRNDQSAGIDFLAPVIDRQVGKDRLRAGAVYDGAALYYNLMCHRDLLARLHIDDRARL
jgi:hypothetical protein